MKEFFGKGTAFIALLLTLFAVAPLFSERVYREIVIDGEKVNKWMEVDSITEYDQQERVVKEKGNWSLTSIEYKGNCIYTTTEYNSPHGGVVVCTIFDEKDRNGNLIHRKVENSIDGLESEDWYEYNSKNLCVHEIHRTRDDNWDSWNEYDSSGNIVSSKTSNGTTTTYRCEKNERVYEKMVGASMLHERWFKYDAQGRTSYCRDFWFDKRSSFKQDEETWMEYNDKNDIIHTIRKNNINGKIFHIYYIYDYEYYPNSKLKKKTRYSCRIE